MKTTPFLLATLFLLSIAACKKDEAAAGTAMVKTMTEDSTTTTYTYDADNRIIKSQSTNGHTANVTYTNNTVTITSTNGVNTYQLNSNGQATSATVNGNITNFVYNTDGKLIREVGSDTIAYVWTNGNMTQLQTSFGAVLNHTYYNTGANTLTNANFGMAYINSSSANLLKSTCGATCDITTEYTYEFDAAGRVAKRVETSMPGGNSNTTTYTYY